MSSSLVREVSADLISLPKEEQSFFHRIAQRLLPKQPPMADEKQEYESSLTGMGRALKEALDDGFEIIRGEPNRLLLDLDKGAVIHEDNLKLLCELTEEMPLMTRWASKSKKGEHVVLQFEKTKFTPAEAIALEVALGSDSKRAVLYIKRIKNNIEEPRVLFKPAKINGEAF